MILSFECCRRPGNESPPIPTLPSSKPEMAGTAPSSGSRTAMGTMGVGPSGKWWSLCERKQKANHRGRRGTLGNSFLGNFAWLQFRSFHLTASQTSFHPASSMRTDVGQREHGEKDCEEPGGGSGDSMRVLWQDRYASVDKFDVYPVDQQ